MNNHHKYLKKMVLLMSLGVVLLLGTSVGYAKDADFPLLEQNKSAQQVKQSVVSLNESSLSQLITLKGIGQTKAHAIMAYRQQFGDFKSISELTKVSGIGDKIIDENKARLSL